MAMKPLYFNILLILLLLLPYHAQAAEGLTPVSFKGIYEFQFSGLPLGRMGVEIEQTADHYSAATDVTLVGIIRLFVQHTSHSTAEGSGQDFAYPDVLYETHYQTRKKRHYIKLEYKNGGLRDEKQIPPDRPGKRPAVPAAMLEGSADPISIILKARQALWEALHHTPSPSGRGWREATGEGNASGNALTPTPLPKGEGAFSINLYDGNRLTQVNFTLIGKAAVRYGNKMLPTIKVAVRRKPLAGFTRSELADYNPKEPTAYFYFTDDDRLLPVKAETTFLATPLTAVLVKECRTGESCLLGIRD